MERLDGRQPDEDFAFALVVGDAFHVSAVVDVDAVGVEGVEDEVRVTSLDRVDGRELEEVGDEANVVDDKEALVVVVQGEGELDVGLKALARVEVEAFALLVEVHAKAENVVDDVHRPVVKFSAHRLRRGAGGALKVNTVG